MTGVDRTASSIRANAANSTTDNGVAGRSSIFKSDDQKTEGDAERD